MEKLKELIEDTYNKKLESAGELKLEHTAFGEFEELRDGKFAFCYQTDFARLSPKEMKEISNYANEHQAEIRLGIDQNIYILGISEKVAPFQSPALSASIVACAGNLCPYAVWSIKDEAAEYLPLEMIYKYNIKVGFSGCAKGCGRHRHTDIGLIGLKTNNFGDTDGGARIFIGAEHNTGQSTARQLFSMVPFVHLKETLILIVRLFEKSKYPTFELYAHHILNNYSEDFLALWHLLNLKTKQSLHLPKQLHTLEYEEQLTLLLEHFPSFQLLENDYKKTISILSKELWTVEGKDPHYKPPIKRTNIR